MVDPHQARIVAWQRHVKSAERQLESIERMLKHPGNGAWDLMFLGFEREIVASQLDVAKRTLRNIEGS